MIYYAGAIAVLLLSASLLLNLYRLLIGPDTVDRILALDTMTVDVIALIMASGIIAGSTLYFEAALFFAMVGFVGTVAFCKYLLRGDVIE